METFLLEEMAKQNQVCGSPLILSLSVLDSRGQQHEIQVLVEPGAFASSSLSSAVRRRHACPGWTAGF